MNTPKPFDIERLFNKIRQLEIHTPQGVCGLLTKESRFIFSSTRAKPFQPTKSSLNMATGWVSVAMM